MFNGYLYNKHAYMHIVQYTAKSVTIKRQSDEQIVSNVNNNSNKNSVNKNSVL